ncbi:MAG: hypothetical protein RL660_234 [Bacteroidota bacterium]|jgi:predicted DNA-binding protein (MmcQ/YjbR family)
MTFDAFLQFCEALPHTTTEFPFGPDVLVMKVKNKMFALCDLPDFVSINLKCDPDKAIELREKYTAVQPGYHMSKVHWNTIEMDGSIKDALVQTWIIDSYKLVIASLPKKDRFDY